MDKYIIICRNQRMAVTLFRRLSEFLYKADIHHRRFDSILAIDTLGLRIGIRFISERDPKLETALTGFRGNVIGGDEVELWLDNHEHLTN